jgi:glycine/D-amino acid oxidase-like deaminating enzyme
MSLHASNISIWEKESFFAHRDIVIVGSGLSGLWSAWHLKKQNPALSIAILERGILPAGASTRNAGFACFGSLTELLSDINTQGAGKMLELVRMRHRGLQWIRETFDPNAIDFVCCGGFELIMQRDSWSRGLLADGMSTVNKLLANTVSSPTTFSFADEKIARFGFNGASHLVENKMEGYLHSGKLCQHLLQLVQGLGVTILNGIEVTGYEKVNNEFCLQTNPGVGLTATNLLICNNAFATTLLPGIDIVPARGQILLTSEIPALKFKGAFHAEEGYYYFRNLGDRVMLGGARHTDFAHEQTSIMETSGGIQEKLERFLQEVILPGESFSITDRWSGIMAMGSEKLPIIREIEPGVFCAVRMSGMGVALTPVIGKMVADMMLGHKTQAI